jgi:hypothetical protein
LAQEQSNDPIELLEHKDSELGGWGSFLVLEEAPEVTERLLSAVASLKLGPPCGTSGLKRFTGGRGPWMKSLLKFI